MVKLELVPESEGVPVYAVTLRSRREVVREKIEPLSGQRCVTCVKSARLLTSLSCCVKFVKLGAQLGPRDPSCTKGFYESNF